MGDTRFTWIESYQAIADALLMRKTRRDGLMQLYINLTDDDSRKMIDPFTFFTTFNRGLVEIDRLNMVQEIMTALEVDAPEPQDFIGIPTANHELWQYFDNTETAAEDCWQLFEAALDLADSPERDADKAARFSELFDKVHGQEHVTKARLTRTLYWMRPNFYLPFGEKAREFIYSRYGMRTPIVMEGKRYLRLLQEIKAVGDQSFVEITERAYHAGDDSWWPDMSDYDPDMSIKQWMELLEDPDTTSDEVKKALYKMLELGGDATMEELTNDRGNDRDYYATLLRGYAKDTARKMERRDCKGSWWPFMFTGKNANSERRGDYIWRLRPEVADALRELRQKQFE